MFRLGDEITMRLKITGISQNILGKTYTLTPNKKDDKVSLKIKENDLKRIIGG